MIQWGPVTTYVLCASNLKWWPLSERWVLQCVTFVTQQTWTSQRDCSPVSLEWHTRTCRCTRTCSICHTGARIHDFTVTKNNEPTHTLTQTDRGSLSLSLSCGLQGSIRLTLPTGSDLWTPHQTAVPRPTLANFGGETHGSFLECWGCTQSTEGCPDLPSYGT